jgi:hypothetical protein
MSRPDQPAKPAHRAYTPFEICELEQIDEWGFARRIRDRSTAIRELVLHALQGDPASRQEAPSA